MELSFGRSEKLKSRKQIEQLFIEGDGIKNYPLRLRYLRVRDSENSFKVGFSVPKRNFKLAVKRNRIKRLIREAYRLNKHIINDIEESYVSMFIYTGRKEVSQVELNNKMNSLLDNFKENIQKNK